MRRCRVWIGAILLLVTVFAVTAPAADAGTSTAELRAKLRSSRKALRAKRERLKVVRADLAAALELVALYGGTAGDELSFTDATLVEVAPATPVDDGDAAPLADEAADATADVADATADATTAAAATDGVDTATDVLPVVVPTAEDVAALERRVERLRASARGWRKRVDELARRVRRRERIAKWNRSGDWRPLIELAARRYGVDAASLYRLMMSESGGRRYAGTTYKGLYQYHPGTWRASWNPWRGASIYNGWAQIRATAYAIKRGYGPSMWPHTYPRAF